MKIKFSKINTQSDSLIKEKSRKEKRHKQKVEHNKFKENYSVLSDYK